MFVIRHFAAGDVVIVHIVKLMDHFTCFHGPDPDVLVVRGDHSLFGHTNVHIVEWRRTRINPNLPASILIPEPDSPVLRARHNLL